MGMIPDAGNQPPEPLRPPPSRHQGSRLVGRTPDVVGLVTAIRADVKALRARVRPEEVSFSAASPAGWAPCVAAAFEPVRISLVYRSGRALFIDVIVATGAASIVEARINVPTVPAASATVPTPGGGGQQLIRLELAFPDIWLMGDAHLVYVEARRTAGADATSLEVLRARQR